jgi:hypothetical protein
MCPECSSEHPKVPDQTTGSGGYQLSFLERYNSYAVIQIRKYVLQFWICISQMLSYGSGSVRPIYYGSGSASYPFGFGYWKSLLVDIYQFNIEVF